MKPLKTYGHVGSQQLTLPHSWLLSLVSFTSACFTCSDVGLQYALKASHFYVGTLAPSPSKIGGDLWNDTQVYSVPSEVSFPPRA